MHRRTFLSATVATLTAGTSAFPEGTNKSGTRNPIFTAGDRRYECIHDCYTLPSTHQWQTSHGLCFDSSGFAYVIMQGHGGTPAQDTVHVFDPQGKYVRSFGKEYHPGGHGIDARKEGSEEFLYLCDVHHNQVIKTNLKGEQVWKLNAPTEPNVYDGKKKYKPTNVAFTDDGGFFIGDGYGSSYIHHYSKDAKWLRTFGGSGKDLNGLMTPHGLWIDNRPGRKGLLAIADRGNNRIVYTSLNGDTIGVVPGIEAPCNIDFHQELAVIPELNGRVTLLGKNNEILARFGDDAAWIAEVKKHKIRNDPKQWVSGKFVHPHDACFDVHGNIYVVEWVQTGRITKLKLL
ncbi:MAG: peptidase [Planctomycetia bacterium]|nr:peptidase [Planctomycetia bacterium]